MMDLQQLIKTIRTQYCHDCSIGKAIEVLENAGTGGASDSTLSCTTRASSKDVPAPGQKKKCHRCGKIKPLDEYPKAKDCPDGHAGTCKACRSAYNKAFYHKRRNAHKKDGKDQRDLDAELDSKKPYQCDVCGKRFYGAGALTIHKEEKHG